MKSTSALPHVLLLVLTTTSLAAPIPAQVEECSHYASCRSFLRASAPLRSSTHQSTDPSPPREPHFPTHQLEFSQDTDTVEVRLLEHHVTIPTIPSKLEHAIKTLELNAVLEATRGDESYPRETLHELGQKSPIEVSVAVLESHSQTLKGSEGGKYGFAKSIIKNMKFLPGSRVQKCGLMDEMAKTDGKHGEEGVTTITYTTYGYSYIRTDHTPVLVVSIVVIFMLAVVLVELLEKFIETSKALLGLDQGAIRLEDGDCEPHSDVCPSYTYSPKACRLMTLITTAAAVRSTKSPLPQSKSENEETSQEKRSRALRIEIP